MCVFVCGPIQQGAGMYFSSWQVCVPLLRKVKLCIHEKPTKINDLPKYLPINIHAVLIHEVVF